MSKQVADLIQEIEQRQEHLREELERADNYPQSQYVKIASQISENESKLQSLRNLAPSGILPRSFTKMKIF